MNVKIFTDGSVKRNPDGPGGYGAILQYTDRKRQIHEKEISAGYDSTTNNRMELMAAIAALETLQQPCRIDLYTDSQYLTNTMTKGWIENWKLNNWRNGSNKPVKNRELWERLLEATAKHEVAWHWIKGHNGHPENERCDHMAVTAAEQPEKELLHDDRKGMRI